MPDVTAPFGFPYPEDTDLVRDGASDIEALAEGVNDQLGLGYLYVGTRYYTSSGTFAKADPFGDSSFDGAKLRAIRVRMVGGGGGGGGGNASGASQCSPASGGSSGTYSESFITDIAGLPTSVTVTRGDGGTTSAGAAGGTGGQSSFDALVTAPGGNGGGRATAGAAPNMQTGPDAPATGTAQLSVAGSPGMPGYNVNATDSAAMDGKGADSLLGAGGRGGRAGFLAANPGTLFGGGGGGRGTAENQAAVSGGAGAAGIVIVDVFA